MGSTAPTSLFSRCDVAPADPAFALTAEYLADSSPNKVALGAGVYRDENAKPWILPVIKKVELALAKDPSVNHEYQPIAGHEPFYTTARDLLFATSPTTDAELISRIASVQTISGTGANHVGAAFLTRTLSPGAVWISDPTWNNHHLLWEFAGPNVEQKLYPYWKAETRSFDYDGMISKLDDEAKKGDIILLHACAHNPTGLDPTKEQWKGIAEICVRRGLFPFFDSAYQGFASGDLDEDAWAIRYFLSIPNLEICVAQSFSKNFGLYGQRVGAFHLVTSTTSAAIGAKSQLLQLTRAEISTSPVYGARIVATVLKDEVLVEEWKADVVTMAERVKSMRRALFEGLVALKTPGTWEHIVKQIGMFSYTGLTKDQVLALKKDWHIYALDSGRISIAGLNPDNVAYVCKAFDAVVRGA